MKKPIEIEAYIHDGGFTALALLSLPAIATLFAPWIPNGGVFLLASLGLVLLFGLLAVNFSGRRLKGRGASISDEGVSATFEGERVWTLAWN